MRTTTAETSTPDRARIRGWLAALLSVAAVAAGFVLGRGLLETPLTGVKVGLCLAAMVLLVAGALADLRQWKRVALAATVLMGMLAVCGATVENSRRTQRLLGEHKIHAWNVFHYVLGTKYFDEMGYFDLYNAALLADSESGRVFADCKMTRDLHTYKEIHRDAALKRAERDKLRQRFGPARWTEFKQDLSQIQSHRRAEGWCKTIRDLGYNPSPAWLVVHRPLLNAVDISNRRTLARLCSIELLLYLVLVAVFWWAFGARPALAATLWLNVYFGNTNLLVGSYLHYDWLVLTVLAVALYRKGYAIWAAVVLGYVAMMRGFPGLLAIHPLIVWVRELITRRRFSRRHTAFLLTLSLTCALMVGLGSTSSRGFEAWQEWREKITVHAYHQPLFSKRIGLKRLFVHDYQTGQASITTGRRIKVMERNMPAFRVIGWTLTGLALLAMIRRRDHNGMLLGLVLVFAWMVTSRYYASIWILAFTWTALDRRRIGNLLSSLALFALVAGTYLYEARGADTWHSYYAANAVVGTLFLALILRFLIRDGVELVRAWRARKTRPPVEPAPSDAGPA